MGDCSMVDWEYLTGSVGGVLPDTIPVFDWNNQETHEEPYNILFPRSSLEPYNSGIQSDLLTAL